MLIFSFAKKVFMASRLEQDFELACSRIDAEGIGNLSMDFDDLCFGLDSGFTDIQNLFYERFGMSGNDVLEQLRKGCMSRCC